MRKECDDMKELKGTYDYMKQTRRVWTINPRTRVQDNKKKNIKKRRQEDKKMIKDGFEE